MTEVSDQPAAPPIGPGGGRPPWVIPLRDDLPRERRPIVTWALAAISLAAFGWQLAAGPRSVLVGGAIPYELLTLQDTWPRDLVPPPLTVLSAMFLHAGAAHLGGNLLFLWIFGRGVEDAMGRPRFLAFYLGAGVAAAAAQVLATAVQAAPLPPGDATALLSVPMVGASGAIAGVLGAYLVLFPRARVEALVLPVPFARTVRVPAWLFIGLWFALQVVVALLGAAGGVAVFAHLGGFVAGALAVRRLGRRPGWRPPAARGA